ncbi:MAG: PilN domain-containing protein, partial [Dehalococcoidia bacterium]|nr:PilN domain-containing protein [Dehalococcoidia bacterium]
PPLDSAQEQRAKVNGDLSKATSLLPGIVELNSIGSQSVTASGTTSHSLTITGTSPDETTIVNYVRDLTNSGQFSEVLISDMREADFNEWQFTLTLK